MVNGERNQIYQEVHLEPYTPFSVPRETGVSVQVKHHELSYTRMLERKSLHSA